MIASRSSVSPPTDEGLLVTCWTNKQRNSLKSPTRVVYYSERKKTKKRPPNIRIMTHNESRWKDDPDRSDVKSPNWEYKDENGEIKKKTVYEKTEEGEETRKESCLVITCCPWQKKQMEKKIVDGDADKTGTYRNYKDDEMQWVGGGHGKHGACRSTNGGTEVKLEMREISTEVNREERVEVRDHDLNTLQTQRIEGHANSEGQGRQQVKLMNDRNSEYSEIHTKQMLGYNNNHNGSSTVMKESNRQTKGVEVAAATTDDSMDLDGLLNLLEEQTESLEKTRTTLKRKSMKRTSSEGGMSSGLAKSAGSLYTIEEQYDNQPTTAESNDEVFQGGSPVLGGDIYVDSARVRENKLQQKRTEISNSKESSPELEDEFFDVPKFPLHLESANRTTTLSRYSVQPYKESSRFHTYHRSDGQGGPRIMPSQFQSNPLYVYDKQNRGYHSTQTLNMQGGQEYEELPDRASINSSIQQFDTDSIRSRHSSMTFGTQTGDEEGAVVVQHDLLSWGKDIDTQSALDVPVNNKHSLQVNTRLQPQESKSRSTSPQTATSFYRAGFGVLDQTSSNIHNRKVNVALKNRTRCCLAEVDFTPDDNTRLVSKVGRIVAHKMQGAMQLTQDTVWDTIRYVAVYELQGMRTQLRDSWFLYTEFSWEGKMCEPVMTAGFFNAYYDQMHAPKTGGKDGHHLFKKIKMGSQRIKVSCKIKRGLAHADIELLVRQD